MGVRCKDWSRLQGWFTVGGSRFTAVCACVEAGFRMDLVWVLVCLGLVSGGQGEE